MFFVFVNDQEGENDNIYYIIVTYRDLDNLNGKYYINYELYEFDTDAENITSNCDGHESLVQAQIDSSLSIDDYNLETFADGGHQFYLVSFFPCFLFFFYPFTSSCIMV